MFTKNTLHNYESRIYANCSLQNNNDMSLKLIRHGSFDLAIELMISKTGKTMLLSKLSNVYGNMRLTYGIT